MNKANLTPVWHLRTIKLTGKLDTNDRQPVQALPMCAMAWPVRIIISDTRRWEGCVPVAQLLACTCTILAGLWGCTTLTLASGI